ncbi:MAG: CopD family protein [Anaerolineales bacterium]|nr:CopD family protein [Anaerolineales bacterium]
METPTWALSIAYWLHMLATVIWIGGLTALSLVVLPAAHKTLNEQAFADLMTALQKRLDPLAWFSVVVLLASGMFQMSANPNYEGFLSIDSLWAGSILVKHLLFGLMVALSAYLTWGLLPALRRNALLRARGKETPAFTSLQRRERWLLRLNLIFGLLVLLLTAMARSVS